MADVHSKEIRSYNMSRIRSKDTKPERKVRSILFSKGFRFRLHDRHLPGTPDLVFLKYKSVVFINGCFWHGHGNCQNFIIPKTRTEWWQNKINKTAENDKIAIKKLEEMGWKVIVIWECNLKTPLLETTIADCIAVLTKN